ncbi:MAG: glycoside hydrolase family 127 protein [Prolixibacteraceae bacterium]|jgi:hypothetical protein|nr:glycoside hydrolase family 127 protein [Prolixibacteraceae bacterium]
MKNFFAFSLSFVLLIYSLVTIAQPSDNPSNYQNNRSPLISKPFIELPLGAISPEGWLKDQLVRQKNGMTGHLDEVYEKVMGKRNGWLGGDGDVWERGSYWIDGLLPLAYILKDDALIAKVKPWVEWALKSQQPDGYFGPSVDHANEPGLQRNNARDWGPKMVVLKFLQQYYSATQDERVSHHARNFNTAYEGTGQLFGPLTGYPCCTSNMHQGWPKFTQNLWYASADNVISALVYAPSKVKAKVGKGINVEIIEFTVVKYKDK